MTTPTPYSGEDRRQVIDAFALVKQMHDDVKELTETLRAHILNEPGEIAQAITDAISKGFPDGDADGHRKAHEAQMTAITARAEFWKKMAFEVTKYGLFGVVSWLAYTVWVGFLQGPHK